MIPLLDLASEYRQIQAEIDAAVQGVLRSGQYVLGPAVESFERDFASYCGTTHAVAVNSGTSALHLALLAAGVHPGDEVVTVPFTFVATVAAIEYAGATPVFVDIDPDHYTMEPSALERAITPKTRAIVPVHLFGQPADMSPIVDIARAHRLAVIEDACQAHGAEYHGRRAGSLGDIGCFSFYPTKNLGACGEGGAAVTNSAALAETMRLLRSWGEKKRYEHSLRGFNYRMEALQGAILGVKLKHVERWTEARRGHARTYNQRLAGTAVRTPRERAAVRHVYHAYSVRLPQRDLWRTALADRGIQTAVHYPIPVHLQSAYRDLGYRAGSFPVAESVAQEILSIPIFPAITPSQIEMVASALGAGLPAGVAAAPSAGAVSGVTPV